MHHPTDRITHTTAFVTPVVEHWLEREIAQWVLPMKDRSDDPSHHERTLLPRSYISLVRSDVNIVALAPRVIDFFYSFFSNLLFVKITLITVEIKTEMSLSHLGNINNND